jgi:hypothetical protein
MPKSENPCPVYEVVVIEDPTEDEAKAGKLAVLKLGPAVAIGSSPENAMVKLIKDNASRLPEDMGRVRVFIRPFAS